MLYCDMCEKKLSPVCGDSVDREEHPEVGMSGQGVTENCFDLGKREMRLSSLAVRDLSLKTTADIKKTWNNFDLWKRKRST